MMFGKNSDGTRLSSVLRKDDNLMSEKITLHNMTALILDNLRQEAYVPMNCDDLFVLAVADDDQKEVFNDAVNSLLFSGEIVSTKRGKLLLSEASGYLTGIFRATSRGFGFVIRDGGDVFISRDDANGAINGDRVMYRITRPEKNAENPEGEIVRVLEHNVTEVVGTLRVIHEVSPARKFSSKGKKKITVPKRTSVRYTVSPDDPRLTFRVEISQPQVNGARDGDKVAVKIVAYPDRNKKVARGRVLRVFGEALTGEANYAAVLYENGIKTSFDPETLAEARAICPGCELLGRRDLRDKVIFTIDGADAKDFDDAISIERDGEGYILGVHIADVAHYVHPGSALDREALYRGTSVYFTDKVVPMLPEELSNGVCSLNRDSHKYALSAFIRMDANGAAVEAEFCESVISSKVRGVYSEVNDVLIKGDSSEYWDKYAFLFPETLPCMIELYEKLLARSRARGSLEIETTEAVILLSEDGFPVDIVPRERGTAERLIEQFMLAANEAAAGFLSSMELPCVYRIHEEPSTEKVQMFSEFIHNLGLDVRPLNRRKILPSSYRDVAVEANEKGLSAVVSPVMLRSLMKAKYSSVSAPHFGLGCDLYCHFTSPIRRYPDLAVHRIIKAALHGDINEGNLPSYTAFAEEAADRSTENELRALNAERDICDLYKTLYMKDKEGEEFEGIISSVTGFGMFVELENTCEGLVPINTLDGWFDFDEKNRRLVGEGGQIFSLGMRVKIRVELCDINARKIEFSFVEKR